MKTRERKKADLSALTDHFKNSKSAMVLSFTKLNVEKDQQFRNELRETGATYKVVKNTLARLAVKDTPFENATEHFNGVTSVAWTDNEPVGLSKVIAKYTKEYKDIFEFKTGIVEGRIVDINEINSIASLPSKDELIAKLLYLLNAPAQRLATVLNAVPRDLAMVVRQVSERPDGEADKKPEAKVESKTEAPAADETPAAETKPDDDGKADQEKAKADEQPSGDGSAPEEVEKQADAAEDKEEKQADAAEESKEGSDEKSETGSDEKAE